MRAQSLCGRLFCVAPLLALTILSAGCAEKIYSGTPAGGFASPTPVGYAAGAATSTVVGHAQDLPQAQEGNAGPAAPLSAAARQMVYSARFDIAAANADEAMGQFIRGVQSAGGYLESREDARVVCRVPAARFQEIVAGMPTLGTIVSQTIRNDDVTRQYHDLRLHIETAEWSRRRVLGLLDKAEKLEDIIKLEEELLKLTATIESLKGTLETLSEQIAYSRIEVLFRARVPEPSLARPDTYSPFPWINRVGAEQVVEGFGPVETTGSPGAGLLSGGSLEGFLIVAGDSSELKAITPDASKLWVREFAGPQRSDLGFWSKALHSDLIDHRGYHLLRETPVRDAKGKEGVELVCDVVVQGQAQRYLVAVYALDAPFWRRGSAVRTVEFVAPVATFEKYESAVRQVFARSL
jgi:hypothetical protein